MKGLIISSVVLSALVWAISGNAIIAGIIFLSSLAIDVIVFKDFV